MQREGLKKRLPTIQQDGPQENWLNYKESCRRGDGINKMDSRNLSIVFSPILLGGDLSQLFLTRWKIQASVIELLINSSEEIL